MRRADGIFTPRQLEVIQLIADGQTYKQIAKTLGVTPKTAETHKAQIFARAGVTNMASLVAYCFRRGLVK